VLLTQYCVGDKIEKNEMGGACSTYGEEQRCTQLTIHMHRDYISQLMKGMSLRTH